MTVMTFAAALNAGLRRALEADPAVVLLGEDIGRLGGVFRVTDGLQKDFGPARVLDTPLAESGIVGTAIGLALHGRRPVCEIQFDGFIYPAFDQIVSQLARFRARTGGRVGLPVTIRVPYGGGIGSVEHHSESPEAYFAATPGLRVVAVSSPQEAWERVQESIACDDPVLFFEPKRRYHLKADVDEHAPLHPLEELGARILRAGTDVTVAAWGSMIPVALDAATAAEDEGVLLEVVDLRTLAPLDMETLAGSVNRTGRLVVVHEAPRTGGLGAEIIASVTERCFARLAAPPLRVTGFDIPYPPARLEQHHVPDLDRILDAVDRVRGVRP